MHNKSSCPSSIHKTNSKIPKLQQAPKKCKGSAVDRNKKAEGKTKEQVVQTRKRSYSVYTPQLCEKIIELMAEGLSISAAAGALSLPRRTLYDWAAKKPELAQALELGKAKRLLFLERELLQAHRKGSNVTAMIFALKNACREEWNDRREVSLTGANGGAIEIVTKVDILPLQSAQAEEATKHE